MCGIAGIVHGGRRPVDPAALQRMSAAMAHRGPDGSGLWHADDVGFAHRRLAIIDLDGGRQPMVSPESGIVLTFNGEIYNFRELRQRLHAEGMRFREHSDTEVVLRAYERWGDACVDHLQGMFAFAAWDPRQARLFAARDRLGIKPFYFRWHEGTLTFASELKAILAADPLARREVDQQSFDRYLRLQYVPAPHTMVAGIRHLRPGHTLSLARDGEPDERRYWRARGNRVSVATEEELDARLDAAVRSHLVADVPVGALLSGGLDSSLVVAHMVRASSAPVHTFSVGFDDPRMDERPQARRVASHLGTVHHEQLITDDDAVKALPGVAAAMDEPLADYAALPTFLIARFAARHVKVVLTGEGADELFAGYRRYRRDRLLAPIARLRPAYQASHVFSSRETVRLLGRRVSGIDGPARGSTAGTRGTLNQLLLRDLEGWLPDNLLVKVDRMTMLSSLEARVPYLDHAFVEYALGIPASAKLSLLRGPNKLLMRRAAARHMPQLQALPKRGFKPPIDAWLRGRLRPLAHDILLSPSSQIAAHVDVSGVRQLLAKHDAGRTNGHRIWALLVHELWSREHRVA